VNPILENSSTLCPTVYAVTLKDLITTRYRSRFYAATKLLKCISSMKYENNLHVNPILEHSSTLFLNAVCLTVASSKVTTDDGYDFHYAELGQPDQDNDNPSLFVIHRFSESLETWLLFAKELKRAEKGEFHDQADAEWI
jgi:hypothetical protein